MRVWVRTDRLTGLGLTTARRHQRDPVAERPGRGRAHRRAADHQRPAVAAQHPDQGAAVLGRGIRADRHPHQSRRLGAAPGRHRAPGARRGQSRPLDTGSTARPAALIAIYQAPGANALTTLGAVKQVMADAARNFPDDLTWKVTYDPTTFVTATIHEVQKTLIEAFVLVVLVVYLFLGNLRATLIPTIAVPVSLIGTFIVLNAIGYSANTVSLLAIVLAIGIVVDDAIVVVEAVEQVMEQHPELSPAEATKMAMGADLRADHRDHAGAAVGVRAGRLHSRHLGRAVPPVRRHRRGVDVPLGDQRADPLAGAVRESCCGRITGRAAGRSAR